MHFTLVHSPLVGPTTWRPVAHALAQIGHSVEVPDLRTAAQTGDPHEFIDAARQAIGPETDVVAGHSGAGFFLPSIASGRSPSARLVFVDAGLPPLGGSATASADFLDRLRALSVDGVLPPWSTWWGDDAMARLVPDRWLRAEFEAELIEVPLRFYETPIMVPDRWSDRRGGFVLLSEGYRADIERARSLGWETAELLGSHLDVVNRADAVAAALLQLAATG